MITPKLGSRKCTFVRITELNLLDLPKRDALECDLERPYRFLKRYRTTLLSFNLVWP